MILNRIALHIRQLTVIARSRNIPSHRVTSQLWPTYYYPLCSENHRGYASYNIDDDIDGKKLADRRRNVDRRESSTYQKDSEAAPAGKDQLPSNEDPDTFGTLSLPPSHRLRRNEKPVQEEEEEDPGDIAERKFHENMPAWSQKLTINRYASLIKGHIKENRIKEAIDVLEERMLKVDRVKPDKYIYNLLISECGRLGYTKKAFSLFNRMKQRDLKTTGATYTALFTACAKSPYLDDGLQRARHLREVILEKGYILNTTNYNAMIMAFGRCGDLETAFELVDEMKEKKMQIDLRSFNFLLQAAATDRELGFRHALLVWQKIYRHGMQPDIYSFNLMLTCTRNCGIGDVETMQNVIGSILFSSKKSIKPPTNTIKRDKHGDQELIVIGREEQQDDDEHAASSDKQVNIRKHEQDQSPNLIAKLPHLGSTVALGEIKTAVDRFTLIGGLRGFLKEMDQTKQLPSVKTFSQLLEVIPQTHAAEKQLLLLMREYGVRTDVDFFNILMKQRTARKDYEGARVSLSNRKVAISLMFDSFIFNSHPQKVLDMIAVARLNPDIATYGILAMSCSTQTDANLFLAALEEKRLRYYYNTISFITIPCFRKQSK